VLETPAWREVESEVDRPLLWVGLAVVAGFLLIGVIGFFTIGQTAPAGPQRWVARAVFGGFALVGSAACLSMLPRLISPVRVRHAASDVLPDVPREPVVVEGAVVHGRLTHELIEDSNGWQLRPSSQVRQYDRLFLLGFGIPFLILGAALWSWIFRTQLNVGGWVPAILAGTLVTLACGGTVLYLIGLIMRAGYRRLSWLSIPRNGGDLELDLAEPPEPENADVSAGVRWIFIGDTPRRALAFPREVVRAVQICPWKVVIGQPRRTQSDWAVQGVLVLANQPSQKYLRLALFLTSDFAGGARLAERLASTLGVPYLFSADAGGIAEEKVRAGTRPPLRCGGTMS
jgi:hypothetical protein